jgi:L-threonylcarbamoyladenylate synthase
MIIVSKDINEAARLLSNEEVIAIPTETVYGLAGNIYSDKAIKQIFATKNRPPFNPLIVHISAIDALHKVAQQIPDAAFLLAERFWPGPLTLILPKKNHISNLVSGGKATVGVRVPNHSLTLSLLDLLDFPLAAPSANPSGRISPTKVEHIISYFSDTLPMVLDGGACQRGVESTIVGFEGKDIVIYRLGAIQLEDIKALVGDLRVKHYASQTPDAPGMLLKHYATTTPLVLTNNLMQEVEKHKDKKIGILHFDDVDMDLTHIKSAIVCQSSNYEQGAQQLYDFMHYLDEQQLDLIIAQKCRPEGLGLTINDRLFRAAQR